MSDVINEKLVKKLPKIANAMQNAFGDLLPLYLTGSLKTRNSFPFLKWDCINTSLVELSGFEIKLSRRGSWSFLLIFEPDSQMVITLIKRNKLNAIQKSKNKSSSQYINELTGLNKVLHGNGSPYSLWGNDSEDNEFLTAIEKECESFTNMKDLSKARHLFIVFDEFKNKLTYLSAIVVDSNFYQVGDAIDMMGMIDPEMPLPLESVPTHPKKPPEVHLSPLALKLREDNKAANDK